MLSPIPLVSDETSNPCPDQKWRKATGRRIEQRVVWQVPNITRAWPLSHTQLVITSVPMWSSDSPSHRWVMESIHCHVSIGLATIATDMLPFMQNGSDTVQYFPRQFKIVLGHACCNGLTLPSVGVVQLPVYPREQVPSSNRHTEPVLHKTRTCVHN